MTKEQRNIAEKIGKLPFRATKNMKIKYTLGSSLEHAISKLPTWNIESIDWNTFDNNYFYDK